VRLWFAPGSDVPLYRQLVTQVVLAILSGDLKPGEKLPSTRELARRFAIHPNTISAGYRELEREGWTETRHGSGVYVRRQAKPEATPKQVLDVAIANFFRAARELGLPAEAVRSRVAQWLAAPPPDHLLLIEPDAELRRILLVEIREATTFPVRETTLEEIDASDMLHGAIPLCRPSKETAVRAALPAGVELITLQISSATAWLAPYLPAREGYLIAVVSQWSEFLSIAKTMLAAAGVPGDALLFCDASRPRWQRGVSQASAILCDAATAKLPGLPKGPQVVVFRLLAESTREMLAQYPASS